jgi:biopolymer transport protein ExbB/TolQ
VNIIIYLAMANVVTTALLLWVCYEMNLMLNEFKYFNETTADRLREIVTDCLKLKEILKNDK